MLADKLFSNTTATAKGSVDAKVTTNANGDIVITIPGRVELGTLRENDKGNPYLVVKAPAVDVVVTMTTPDGEKERVLTSSPINLNLNFRLK